VWFFSRDQPKVVLELDKSELKKFKECVIYYIGELLVRKIREFTSIGIAGTTIPIPYWKKEYSMLYAHRENDNVKICNASDPSKPIIEIPLSDC